MSYDAPYAGLKVVDMSQGLAGPYAGMLLAQHGADVCKVEPLQGDWARHLGKIYVDQTPISIIGNLGKRSIALDLKTGAGPEILARLLARADVFIESFRPGVTARLGFGYEALAEENARLLYVSVSGVGSEGPMKDRPITDSVMQAFSGFMSANRGPDGMPHKTGVFLVDMTTGLYTFQAIATALFAREREQRGRLLECHLLGAATALQGLNLVRAHLEGEDGQPVLTPAGTYAAADGHVNLAVLHDKDFGPMCDALGLEGWKDDPRFAGNALRHENREALEAGLSEALGERTCAELAGRLAGTGVLFEQVNSYREYLAHPQLEASAAVTWVEDARAGTIPIPTIPGRAPHTPAEPAAHAPTLGQHGEEILRELGYSTQEIARLAADNVVGGPL